LPFLKLLAYPTKLVFTYLLLQIYHIPSIFPSVFQYFFYSPAFYYHAYGSITKVKKGCKSTNLCKMICSFALTRYQLLDIYDYNYCTPKQEDKEHNKLTLTVGESRLAKRK
jgi:hypothetical protein